MSPRLACLLLLLLVAPARAATFFVDPRGDDAAAGDQSAPWQTIGRGAGALVAGDVLLVAGGTYRESVGLTRSGVTGAPITVRDLGGARLESPQPAASLSGFNLAAGVSDIVIEGFTLHGFDETVMVRPGAHDIVIRGCTADGNTVGVWIAGAHDVLVEACTLRRNRIGLRILGASERITVRDTVASENDDGAGCDGDADGFSVEETARDIRFVGCAAVANGEDGFDLQGDAVQVQGVVSRDNACSGIKLGQSARVENALVIGNTTGIAIGALLGVPTTVVVNSTIADNRGTQLLLRARTAAAPASVLLRNLIASGAGKVLEIEAPLALSEDHNLFFRSESTSAVIVRHLPDGGDRRYTGREINAGVWTLETGLGADTLAIDPGFSGADYGVGADGPAVDRGMSDAAPTDDQHGVPRPQGGGVDIGPDELTMA
ncbi:MAG: right-handed parallel beta-helix repeat-containing protein, partial [bacterium]